MKHAILFLFVALLTQKVQSQDLHIVKDNVNCTYGIKDKDGNWVVDATYILIEEYNSGYFLMRDEMGLGVFSPTGKELIPCKYDQLLPLPRDWSIKHVNYYQQTVWDSSRSLFFEGIRNNHSFFINNRGEELAEFGKHVMFEFDVDSMVIAYDTYNRTSSYFDTIGTIFFKDLSGQIIPFGTRNFTLIGKNEDHYNNHHDRTSARLIDRHGKLLLKDTFDLATIDSKERICYRLKGLYGVTDALGDTILPPQYVRRDGSLNFDAKYWTISNGFDQQFGIMRNDGTVMIEPAYASLSPLNGSYTSELWFAVRDGKTGLINLSGETIIPMKFHQLNKFTSFDNGKEARVYTFVGTNGDEKHYIIVQDSLISSEEFEQINYTNSSNNTYLIVKRNGKFGVLKADGSLSHPLEFDAHFPPSSYYDKRHFFSQGDQLTSFDFSGVPFISESWTRLVSDKSTHIYADSISRRTLALEMSSDGKSILKIRDDLYVQKYEHLLVVSTKNWEEATLFNIDTKRKSPLKNIKMVSAISKDLFWIDTKHHRRGVIDSYGKVIVDTLYHQLEKTNSNKYWAQKSTSGTFKWILLDSIGRQVIPNQFDASFQINAGDQIAIQNGKKGLIDSKTLQWKIRPNYFCMIGLVDDYYYVGNELNKKGIIRSDGEVILSMEYDSLFLLYTNCQYKGSCPKGIPTEIKWLVRKGNAEYLADQNGKLINSRSSIKNFKGTLFFDDDTTFSKLGYHYQSFPTLDYSPSLHFLRDLSPQQIQLKRAELWKNSILKNQLLDTINKIWTSSLRGCNQGYYIWGVTIQGNQPKPNPLLEKARRSCECYESNGFTNYSGYSPYQLRSIGSKFLTINISYQNRNISPYPYSGQELRPIIISNDQHINIIEEKGKARHLKLKDIFPDDDILMQEFMEALKLRDDLKLECSSLENMLAMVNGNFSLSDEGVMLHLNQYQYNNYYGRVAVELLIPIERLEKLLGSSWIVPILESK